MNTEDANKISEDSLIREIIKHSEIIKFISIEDLQNDKLINDIIVNIYKNLNLVDLNDFENYLKEFGFINDVFFKKISIELLWNQSIVGKFNNQININENELKKRIKKDNLDSQEVLEYNLSEIVFQANNQIELDKKINQINTSIKNEGFNTAANKFSISDTSKTRGIDRKNKRKSTYQKNFKKN